MKEKYKLCIYRMTTDTGFAPNPFGKYCTLATCMVKLRSSSKIEPGTWVVGIGGVTTPVVDKLIYAMRVSLILPVEKYWLDSRFGDKKPNHSSTNPEKWVGDNIYHKKDDKWIQEPSLHSHPNGTQNHAQTKHDVDVGKYVLISDHFFYFGGNALKIPIFLIDQKKFRYKCNFPASFTKNFVNWLNQQTPGIHGNPSMLPKKPVFKSDKIFPKCECMVHNRNGKS